MTAVLTASLGANVPRLTLPTTRFTLLLALLLFAGSNTNKAHGNIADTALPFEKSVTICIKHTPFNERRVALQTLLKSIRARYPLVELAVASEGPPPIFGEDEGGLEAFDARHVQLENDAGLAAGRNALVLSTTTPFFVLVRVLTTLSYARCVLHTPSMNSGS